MFQLPLTGKIAFSPDGKRLAASGAGQVVCVLDVTNFRVDGSSMTVAGDGATALAWCGSRSDLLFAADDAKRYAFQAFDQLPRYRSDICPPLDVKQNCVAMAQTPDDRRVACLEAGGAVNFVGATSNSPAPVWDCEHKVGYTLVTKVTSSCTGVASTATHST